MGYWVLLSLKKKLEPVGGFWWLPDFLVVHVWQKQNILYCLYIFTSWSLVCWLAKGRRFRAEVTIEWGIFLGFLVLWGVFSLRDRFLMFSCLLVFSSRSSSFCVLWQVEANISKFLFRRRTLSWQLLQQNLGSSSLSKTSISPTLRIILFNCNAFPLSLKK